MDLIDRRALLDALDPKYKETMILIKHGEVHLDNLAEGFLECSELIKAAPTIEPKRGQWEGYVHSAFYGMDDFDEPIYRDKIVWYCSNPKCRRKTVIKENYCPNCGADMRACKHTAWDDTTLLAVDANKGGKEEHEQQRSV